MIEIDGSMGEGGGQVLRSSLALSMITGQPVSLTRIRAGRGKPGLLRQHLTCVNAAAAVCGAAVEGAQLRSDRVVFRPGPVVAGAYQFAVGSAGSASLVLQTVLPALLLASSPSTVVVEGGTHNSAAPPFHFLERSFAPHVGLGLTLEKWGFYPAGGGRIRASVKPRRARIDRMERGELTCTAHAAVSAVSPRVGHAALGMIKHALGLERDQLVLHEVAAPIGPGFAVWIEARSDTGGLRTEPRGRSAVSVREAGAPRPSSEGELSSAEGVPGAIPPSEGWVEVFTAFGERRESPEIAQHALAELDAWRARDVPVGEHLADQLLIPMALFGGQLRTGPLSLHARTNIEVIERFLPVRFRVEGAEVAVARGWCGTGV